MRGTAAYVLRRLGLAGPVLLGMSVFVFAIIHLTPGDPVQAALGLSYSPGAAKVLRHQMGLDQPIVNQYFSWLGNTLHGNFGQDLISHQPLGELLSQRLPVTLELTILSMGLAVLLAVPLGVAAARNPGGFADRPGGRDHPAGHLYPGFRARHPADPAVRRHPELAAAAGLRALQPEPRSTICGIWCSRWWPLPLPRWPTSRRPPGPACWRR